MKRFRIKFVLADGRQVYASKRGTIQLLTAEEVARLNPTHITASAFSADLKLLFTQPHLFPSTQAVVRVVGFQPEPEDSPLDSATFLQGGRLAV